MPASSYEKKPAVGGPSAPSLREARPHPQERVAAQEGSPAWASSMQGAIGNQAVLSRLGRSVAPGRAAGGAAAARAAGPVGAGGGAGGPASLLGNPTPRDPKHELYALPDLSQGFGGPAPAPQPGGQSIGTSVRVLAGPNNPVELQGGLPGPSQLYVEDPAGTTITAVKGDVQAPLLEELATDAIFIDGRPVADDVSQGGLGDCYFMAVLIELASKDPQHVVSLMNNSGRTVSSRFYFYDSSSGEYQPVQVTTDKTLLMELDPTGQWLSLEYADFRVDERPRRTQWYAQLVGNALEIHARAFYDTAMWAPLLEKAYAAFAEQYGQFGGAPVNSGTSAGSAVAPTPNSGSSGYERMEGGFEYLVYPLFYGEAVQQNVEMGMNWQAGGDNLALNVPALIRLLQLQGKGLQAGEKAFVTVGAWTADLLPRAREQVDRVLDYQLHHPIESLGELGSGLLGLDLELRRLHSAIERWEKAQTDKEAGAAKAEALKLAGELAEPGNYPLLHEKNAPEVYRELLELLADLRNSGTDSSAGQRMIYAEHAYAVVDVSFRSKDGSELDLEPATLVQHLSEIDPGASTVRIRNPHHTNEPDLEGTGPADRVDEGEFTLSLDEFFRNYSVMDVAVVQEPLVGDFPQRSGETALA